MRAASDDGFVGDPLNTATPDMAPALQALAALDRGGVQWCVLRDGDALPSAGGEVDVLVASQELAAAEQTLARAGFAAVRAWGRTPHRFYVGGDPAATLKVDVVTALAFGRWGELRVDGAVTRLVLARRRRHGAVSMPAPDDAFWALLLHVLLDRNAIDPTRAEQARALARQAGDESALAKLVDAACPPGWTAARVRAAAAAGDLRALRSLAPALRTGWPVGSRRRRVGRVLASRLLRRLDRRLPGRAPRPASAQTSGLITSKSRLSSTG